MNHAQAGDLPGTATQVDKQNHYLNLGGDTHGPMCACMCGTALRRSEHQKQRPAQQKIYMRLTYLRDAQSLRRYWQACCWLGARHDWQWRAFTVKGWTGLCRT
jgi:hypothetical protein